MSHATRNNFIIALGLFVVIGGAVAFAFIQLLNNSKILEQQIVALSGQSKQEAALIQLQKTAQGSETEREELASYFLFRESDSIGFLSEIESIAPVLNLSLETIGLQKLQADNRDWVEAIFSVHGGRVEIENLLEILENTPYVSRVTNVDMSSASLSKWQAEIVIQVQLLSYDQ